MRLKFDSRGLIPAVIQDAKTGEVLMVAYMSRQSLARTLETGKVHFYSRSRRKLWLKGESSGHIQTVRSFHTDCDQDTVLLRVHQRGGACHTGYRSCFFQQWDAKRRRFRATGRKVFDPNRVYRGHLSKSD